MPPARTEEQRNAKLLEGISDRINALVIVLIVLGVVLVLYMVVECGLLIYSVYKKKKVSSEDPDSVVVKGRSDKKKKRSSKASKKKKSKRSSKSSKSSRSSSRKPGQKPLPKAKKASVSSKSSASTDGVVKKAKQLKDKVKDKVKDKMEKKLKDEASTQKSSRKDGKSVQTARPISDLESDKSLCATSSTAATQADVIRIPPQFPPQRNGPVDKDTATGSLIAQIPNQFPTSRDGDNFTTNDVATEQLIKEIPPQFESKGAGGQFTQEQLAEIAKQVAAVLSSSSRNNSQPIVREKPESPKANVEPPVNHQQPQVAVQQPMQVQQPVQVQQPTAFAQPVYAQNPLGQRQPADSVYLMEIGHNGETPKIAPPIPELHATNSLMFDAGKVVPVEGKPNTASTQHSAPGAGQ